MEIFAVILVCLKSEFFAEFIFRFSNFRIVLLILLLHFVFLSILFVFFLSLFHSFVHIMKCNDIIFPDKHLFIDVHVVLFLYFRFPSSVEFSMFTVVKYCIEWICYRSGSWNRFRKNARAWRISVITTATVTQQRIRGNTTSDTTCSLLIVK